LIASLVLGFIFSFKEWGSSTPDGLAGIENWLRYFIMSIVALLIHTISHKIVATKNYAISEFRLWNLTVGERKKIKTIPLGVLIPLLFSFFSNGSWNVALIENNVTKEIPALRARKKFKYLTELEIALIAIAGPLASILFALILKASQLPGLDKFIMVNYIIGLFALIPFSTLDGAKIFAGSRFLYLAVLIFLVGIVLLMYVTSPITSIIFAIVLSIILTLIYMYKTI